MSLPLVPPIPTIKARLLQIFPEGLPRRNYVVRDMAAHTVFTMLYVGAIEGTDRWIRPSQVTRMTNAQAAQLGPAERTAWALSSVRPTRMEIPGRWYAENSREPIRDETLRSGFQRVGAVVERSELAVTSATPRWALAREFADLFLSSDDAFHAAAESWRESHLSTAARARVTLARRNVSGHALDGIRVSLPSGELRRLPSGVSSQIAKALIEVFAPRYMYKPGVLWLSDSRNHVVAQDDELAREVGLSISDTRILPDIVLVDLEAPNPPLFVFVEVVASEGPMDEQRKAVLLELLSQAGYYSSAGAFGTAYWDRGGDAFRRTVGELAWNSFAWAATEPNQIILNRDTDHAPGRLTDFLPTI